jgi:hypothetical protein
MTDLLNLVEEAHVAIVCCGHRIQDGIRAGRADDMEAATRCAQEAGRLVRELEAEAWKLAQRYAAKRNGARCAT